MPPNPPPKKNYRKRERENEQASKQANKIENEILREGERKNKTDEKLDRKGLQKKTRERGRGREEVEVYMYIYVCIYICRQVSSGTALLHFQKLMCSTRMQCEPRHFCMGCPFPHRNLLFWKPEWPRFSPFFVSRNAVHSMKWCGPLRWLVPVGLAGVFFSTVISYDYCEARGVNFLKFQKVTKKLHTCFSGKIHTQKWFSCPGTKNGRHAKT